MDLLGGYGSDDSSEEENEATTQMTMLARKQPPTKGESIISKRGKRLVSLHAVLPTHLLEILTKGGEDNSDDDDEPIPYPRGSHPKPIDKSNKRGDAGLASLLSELKSVPKNSLDTTTTAATLNSEKMGLALQQVLTKVTSTPETNEVVDIHKVTLNDVKEEDNCRKGLGNVSIGYSSTVRSPASISRVYANIPRPSTSKIQISAPDVTLRQGVPEMPPTIPEPFRQSTQKADISHAIRKRSRREIEKALRSGDLDAVNDADQFQMLDTESNAYVLDQSADVTQSKSGVRIAPVAMYDTKAGSDVLGAGVSGKARSKNQINFLMVSAAAFEANEAQKAKIKTQRASAKRKYGW